MTNHWENIALSRLFSETVNNEIFSISHIVSHNETMDVQIN